jgi:hypothetical protein
MNRLILTLGLWLLGGISAFADVPITEQNWVNHPQIVEIRSLYQKLNVQRDREKLIRKERQFDCSLASNYNDYEGDIRVLYTDRKGRPRIYYHEGGSEDSMVRVELFYDEHAKLRFALIKAGAVNDTKEEIRIYFSKSGTKIWENEKLLEGPGYPFVEWGLVEDPVQAFNDKSPCPELVRKQKRNT